METLHDLLKRDGDMASRPAAPRVDLRRHYSPIGLSAVAAAVRYAGRTETDARSAETGTAVRRDGANR